MSAKIQEALTVAKDKAEQDVTAKTPISAPKKKTTSARANEEVSNKSSPTSVIAKSLQSTDLVADRKSDVALLPSFNELGDGPRSGAGARREEGGAEELPSRAEVEGGARRRVEANGGVQRPDQEGGTGAH